MKCEVKLKTKNNIDIKNIEPDNEISLLISMERKGMNVQYGCLIGVCQACELKITKGKENVEYFEDPIFDTDGDLIYPCCCKIKGNVELEKID
jgi:ferredoxin